MLLMKVVLLIWYSNKNFCFRKIRSHLAPKIDFEIWKCPIFDGSSSNSLTRYKQILSGCSFVTKKLLNFAWLPVKFHNRGHICDDIFICSDFILFLKVSTLPKSSNHLLFPKSIIKFRIFATKFPTFPNVSYFLNFSYFS